MSLKNSILASLLASSALWAIPALAEDSYRTVPPDAVTTPRAMKVSRAPAHEAGAMPAMGGSGMMDCPHMTANECSHAGHGQHHARTMANRSPAGGHSLHPSTSAEPLRH